MRKRDADDPQGPPKEISMTDLFPVPDEWKKRALMTKAQYEAAYAASVTDPDGFWRKEAARLDWAKPFTKVMNVSYDPANPGTLTAAITSALAKHPQYMGEAGAPLTASQLA